MPNTDPVTDSAAVLGALIEAAESDAAIPVGFLAAITKGQSGQELTEMGELADAGAAGFTDDGHPVVAPGLMRRALQYHAITGRRLALHCEEPTLSRGGHMHEGAVSAELGFTGYPSVAESLMVERDLSLAAYEGQLVHLMHLSARESVEALARAQASGLAATGEVTPHHLCLTDEAVRSLDSNVKMNPPLRAEEDRQALIDALRSGTIGSVATDHAPHARHEKEVPFEAAPFGVTGLETSFAVLYTELVATGVLPLEILLERMSDGPARAFGLEPPRIAVGAPGEPHADRHRRELAGRRGRVPLALGQLVAARPDAGEQGAHDRGRRPRGVRGMTAFLALEDGTVFPGESVGAPGFAFGEAVFTTAMTGYQEVVTDPSFSEQIVCFTRADGGQLRRRAGRAPSRAVCRPGPCSCGRREGRPGRTGCTIAASSPSRESTRARSCCTCASGARCAR